MLRSRYRNLEILPQGQDLDAEGRPKNRFDVFADGGFDGMSADDAALAEIVGSNGEGMSKLVSAYDRTREPATVQYEGEYEDHVSVHAAPKKTQYDRMAKGINPEDL